MKRKFDDTVWVDDLKAYMTAHELSEGSYAELPDSVKEAHEHYSRKAKHRFPGIEIGAAMAACYAKANGLESPSEEGLMKIARILTVWIGAESVAGLAGITFREPSPGESVRDYLREWVAEEKG